VILKEAVARKRKHRLEMLKKCGIFFVLRTPNGEVGWLRKNTDEVA
jgi:hypothetical protein